MWLLWAVLALGWEHGAPYTIPTHPALDHTVLATPTGPVHILLTKEGLVAVRDKPVARVYVDGVDLVHDGTDLFVCGRSGVFVVPFAGDRLGAARSIDREPCSAIAIRPNQPGPVLVAAGPQGARIIAPTMEGALVSSPLDLAAHGDILLAAGPEGVALAALGDGALPVMTDTGGALIPLGGPLTALGGSVDGLVWALGGDEPVLQRALDRYPIARPADGVASLDLGEQQSTLLAWDAAGWLLPTLDLPPGPPLAADINGDGCMDLVVLLDAELLVAPGRCDGESVAAVDNVANKGTEPDPDIEPGTPDGDATEIDEDEPTDQVELEDEVAHEDHVEHKDKNKVENEDEDEDEDLWPPPEWAAGERMTDEVLPPAPEELELGTDFPELHVFVGTELAITLHSSTGTPNKLATAPPGSSLRNGRFEYTPDPYEIGTWRVGVRTGPGRWTGFVLHIWPRPRPGEPLPPMAPATIPSPSHGPQGATTTPSTHPWTLGRCALGVGAAGGASRSGGLLWEDLGSPSVQPSASPAVGVICPGGGDGWVQWAVGLDAAPWFRYTDIPTDRSHLLGAILSVQFGTQHVRAGPYASAGVTAVNVGARAQAWFSSRYGVELRAGWLAPRAGVEAMVLVLRQL